MYVVVAAPVVPIEENGPSGDVERRIEYPPPTDWGSLQSSVTLVALSEVHAVVVVRDVGAPNVAAVMLMGPPVVPPAKAAKAASENRATNRLATRATMVARAMNGIAGRAIREDRLCRVRCAGLRE